MRISIEDPATPDIASLLEQHLAVTKETAPPESCHALDATELRAPHITFLATRDNDGMLLGMGALADLGDGHGEIKSMHTASGARGRGVAAAVLTRLIEIARESGHTRLSLETGTQDFFDPAHRLYERHGFTECEPFDSYVADPHSRFYALVLESQDRDA
ncbi:MAG: GNAT family N-acetyltransferase [Actinobacteria bacterium HGW-Actinobacteria-8]|nr:MAG: GNAT family N-acetyltransferase [Actinobacteria bacterium HGW-Actinobacteria-8]